MMQQPARTKYRKTHKGRNPGFAYRGSTISFGTIALQATESGLLTAREIEAARIAMTRQIKRGGRVFIRVYCDKPVCKKPLETRMGKGKGAPDHYVVVIKGGRILFEIEGVSAEDARPALRLASYKLSVKTRIITTAEAL